MANDSPLTQDQRVLHTLNRLTFGPRPGDVAAVEAMGLDKWIDKQLQPETIDDSVLEARLAAYPAMRLSRQELIRRFPSPAMIRQAEQGRRGLPGNPVERAIYQDQIAALRNRQQAKGSRQQAATVAMRTQTDDMAPPPAPDMMPTNDSAKADEPSIEEQEQKLYADLDAAKLVDLPPDQRVKTLVEMQPEEFRDFLRRLRRADRVALFTGLSPEQKETVFALINPQLVVGGELLVTRVLRDVYSERQLEAVMTDFWLNHFNVYLRKGPFAPWYLVDYQNKVIRPHALGKFEDLLVATAESPAMLFYLDQTQSVGPHSLAAMRAEWFQRGANGKARPVGLNENYARELMELHTLGADGGYTQRDVTEVAKIFTGWGIERPDEGGDFMFNPRRHEPGSKAALGHRFGEGGESEGREVLHLLATSPVTAHHVSLQIAQRFVSDNPPEALVDRMAATWVKTGGEIREVMRTMLESPEFWSKDAYRAKVKTPEEYVISAVRATGGDVVHPAALVEAIGQLGMPLYGCQTPNGYSWMADAWLNSGGLLDRMNFSMALADNNAGTVMNWDKLMEIETQAGLTASAKENKLENLLLGGAVSEHTRSAALGQLAQQAGNDAGTPIGRGKMTRPVNFVRPREFGQLLNAVAPLPPPADQDAALLGGLLLGSPEFQRR
ncbi:MAG TPA: DUF1800 domain-containing protein [Acidobacteriaceae bacterium]|nr:DUF1800 domain-containing protein [Acidobacteriaceae bacterium]